MDPANNNYITTSPVIVTNGNKMEDDALTMPLNVLNSDQHELKITDVEGAIGTDLMIITDSEDNESNHPQSCAGLESTLNNSFDNKHVDEILIEEDASAKEELDSVVSYNAADPMGLLERMDKSNVPDNDVEDDSADESSGSSSTRRLSKVERWKLWMTRWAWLLHEESDLDYAFCLYCNIIINVNLRSKYIKQHNMSLYHQERESNYLAFKNSEEQTRGATSPDEIKQEFGTDSYVAAMKQKRTAEVEALNNFNWIRWLQMHPWLERVHSVGTIGLCKYCNIRMNVEFVYLRKRHEASKGHCEAEREYMKKGSRKRKRSESVVEEPVTNVPERRLTEPVKDLDGGDPNDPKTWCEPVSDTKPQQVRCTLCDCCMAYYNFKRHCGTKIHTSNIKSYMQQKKTVNRGIWAQYAKDHPWMVADPEDGSLAFCQVCQKRFMYGSSEIKRRNHENSSNHLAAVAAAAPINEQEPHGDEPQYNSDGNVQSGSESEEPDCDPAESDEPENNSATDEDYNVEDDQLRNKSSKRRAAEKRKTKFKKVKHYSWLRYTKDRKIQICKFCRVRLLHESSKARHEQSLHHRTLVEKYKAQRAEQKNKNSTVLVKKQPATDENVSESTNGSDNLSQKPPPPSMHGKVLLWKERFPWLSYKRNEPRPNYGWCKLCEVSVFLPSFKFATKHQRSGRHIRLRFERKEKALTVGGNSQPTTPTAESKNKAAMDDLQLKYSWLEPDTIDENHCRCNVCDVRLPIKLFYLKQHDGSRKHNDQFDKQKNNTTAEPEPEPEPEADADADVEADVSVMEAEQDSDEVVSIKSEFQTEQPQAKRLRRSFEMRRIMRVLRDSGKRKDERTQFDLAKDMICSSFDIVERLRTMERQSQILNSQPPVDQQVIPAHSTTVTPQSRQHDTMDLFFESIRSTMKELPTDLAAEGKAKIMQIICDLEVRAVRRNASQSEMPMEAQSAPNNERTPSSPNEPAPLIVNNLQNHNGSASNPVRSFEDIVGPLSSSSSSSSSITIEDVDDEPLPIANNTERPATSTASQQLVAGPNRTSVSSTNPIVTNGVVAAIPRRSKEVPANIRRILPSTLQVTARAEPDGVRCVPLNQLTHNTPTSQASNTTATVQRSIPSGTIIARAQQPKMSANTVAAITASLASCGTTNTYTDNTTNATTPNATAANLLRKIRVNKPGDSYVAVVQKTSQMSPLPRPTTTVSQAQVTNAQIRALSVNRTVVRHVSTNRTPMYP